MDDVTSADDGVVRLESLLPQLADALMRLGVQLDLNEPRREGRAPQRRWVNLIRQLYVVDALGSGDRTVVVTGEQGAGKTLLMRNLYPEAKEWLEDNAGRGEKNPVRIIERAGLPAPRGRVTFRVPGKDAVLTGKMTMTEDFDADRRTVWRDWVRGEDPAVLLCTLEVPTGFWGIDGTGFVLLPGLERAAGNDWQQLLKIVLATSTAAILVADERRMANAAQIELLKHMRSGHDDPADDLRFVVAISRCEASAPDVVAGRVKRAVEVFGIDEDDVVPIGKDTSSPPGWEDRLLDRVDRIRSGTSSRRLQNEVLRSVVGDDLLAVLDAARSAQVQHAIDNEGADIADRFLEKFDKECDEIRTRLERTVAENFETYTATADRRMRTALQEAGRWKEIGRRIGDFARLDRGERYERLAALVDGAWWGPGRRGPENPTGPLRVQLESVQAVAEARWSVVRQQLGEPQGARFDESVSSALSGQRLPAALSDAREAGQVLREKSLDKVITALPVMALYSRAFAMGLADENGAIQDVTSSEVSGFLGELTDGHKKMLMALGMLLGGDLLADGDLDTPANIAKVAEFIFTGTSGTATATAGAGAAAGTAMLAVIGVGIVAATLVTAANDAIDERDNMAKRHLGKYAEGARERTLRNVDELLSLTREVLQARLYTALGVNRLADAQFGLMAATQAVQSVRVRMVEALADAEFR